MIVGNFSLNIGRRLEYKRITLENYIITDQPFSRIRVGSKSCRFRTVIFFLRGNGRLEIYSILLTILLNYKILAEQKGKIPIIRQLIHHIQPCKNTGSQLYFLPISSDLLLLCRKMN